MLTAILLVISIGGFIFSRIARDKAQSILVSYNLTVNEETIRSLGLYSGLALRLERSPEKDIIDVWVIDAAGKDVLLGSFSSPIEYDILRKKKINANVYSITGNIVAVEVKLHDAL